ncbi:ABC transporter permease [Streptomyces sp. ActVer]|uniref:ABC transporter permease n=1 Tax=Streptomyces sp. ActVer TaxID=3014558 RepID=UPI0022B55E5E|nr:ABC transporter permease [Streptomyces sp. ActVer]MCZ4510213.1 ABC transporter permease [Streptomyces sp. ActVer]
MSTARYAVRDSVTMLRRNLKHMARYPSMTVMLIGQPLLFLLLFVYVFGATMGAGLPGAPAGVRGDYLTFITPGILVMTVASVSIGTAVLVATDMTNGIIDRFRTMAIAKVSVLGGRVLGAMIQTALALAVIFGVAFLLGLETAASVLQWSGLVGLLVLLSFAMTWFTVALGLASPDAETASNLPMIFVLLPFVGSGFVPADGHARVRHRAAGPSADRAAEGARLDRLDQTRARDPRTGCCRTTTGRHCGAALAP